MKSSFVNLGVSLMAMGMLFFADVGNSFAQEAQDTPEPKKLTEQIEQVEKEVSVIPQGAYGFVHISGEAAKELYHEILNNVYEDDLDGVFYRNTANLQCFKIPNDPEPPIYGCNLGFTNDGKALELHEYFN